MRDDRGNLREWAVHQHGGWSDLRVPCRIQIERQAEFDEVHRRQGGSVLRPIRGPPEGPMLLPKDGRYDEETLLLHHGQGMGQILRAVSSGG